MSSMIVTALALASSWGQRVSTVYERPQLRANFFQGKTRSFAEGQSPRPRWVTTKWDPKADKPFESIEKEMLPFKDFKGPDLSATWPKKAKTAYEAWKKDWHDPVKLYRACAYLINANELDPKFQRSKEKDEMYWDLNLAFQVIKNPPRSYLFVRMAYRMSAGDGEDLYYGDLARHLLKKNPHDLPVLVAASQDIWYAALGSVDRQRELEDQVLSGLATVKRTKAWRPWSPVAMGRIYYLRAMVERSVADAARAIECGEEALKNTPKVYDTQWIKDAITRAKRLRDSLKE
jgi:hypothetical protein